ncbi:MAG: hypothetical protein LBQ55_10870 [Treponema sp.]|jgi:hypothetical protein|nr:hypothetical protein [Treponema sp.]
MAKIIGRPKIVYPSDNEMGKNSTEENFDNLKNKTDEIKKHLETKSKSSCDSNENHTVLFESDKVKV